MQDLLTGLILLYRRYLSPQFGGGCRFEPSCSQYALECIRRYGAGMGLRLTLSRLARCRPEYPCGRDPVPEADQLQAALRGRLLRPNEASEPLPDGRRQEVRQPDPLPADQ